MSPPWSETARVCAGTAPLSSLLLPELQRLSNPSRTMAFNPVKFVQAAYKNSPWVVISVGFHVAVAAVIAAFAVSKALEKNYEKAVQVALSSTKIQ